MGLATIKPPTSSSLSHTDMELRHGLKARSDDCACGLEYRRCASYKHRETGFGSCARKRRGPLSLFYLFSLVTSGSGNSNCLNYAPTLL